MRRHLGCSPYHQLYKPFDPYIITHYSAVQGTYQPDTVGKLRVGEFRSKDSNFMKITVKFVAKRKYSSSGTGSHRIRHIYYSQGPADVYVPKKTKLPQQFGS